MIKNQSCKIPILYHYTQKAVEILSSKNLHLNHFKNYHSKEDDPYENAYFLREFEKTKLYQPLQKEKQQIEALCTNYDLPFQEDIYFCSLTTEFKSDYHLDKFGNSFLEINLNCLESQYSSSGIISLIIENKMYKLCEIDYLRKGQFRKNMFDFERFFEKRRESENSRINPTLPLRLSDIEISHNSSHKNIMSKRNKFVNEKEWRFFYSSGWNMNYPEEVQKKLDGLEKIVVSIDKKGKEKKRIEFKFPQELIQGVYVPQNYQTELLNELRTLHKKVCFI